MKIFYRYLILFLFCASCSHELSTSSAVATHSSVIGSIHAYLDVYAEDHQIEDREISSSNSNYKKLMVMDWQVEVDSFGDVNTHVDKLEVIARSARTGSKMLFLRNGLGKTSQQNMSVGGYRYPTLCFTSSFADIELSAKAWLIRHNENGTFSRTPEESPLQYTVSRSMPFINTLDIFRGTIDMRRCNPQTR